MARLLRIKFAGAKYHVTQRGNGRQRLFFADDDYERFLSQTLHALTVDQVVLYAYVLMPNHYHLLVETPHGNIDRFEQRLNTAYSLYFRYKHARPGHVLQGRYGGKLVSGDDYLLRATRYIHLNPVKTETAKRCPLPERAALLDRYRWSSYRGYVDHRLEQEWVDYRWRRLVGSRSPAGERKRYRRYVESFVAEDDEVCGTAMQRSRYAIGDERFVEEIEEKSRAQRRSSEYPADIVWPEARKPTLEQVNAAVSKAYGITPAALLEHGRSVGQAKRVAIELCCRLTGLPQRAVGKHYRGMSCTGVAYQRRRLRTESGSDPTLRSKLVGLEKRILQLTKH